MVAVSVVFMIVLGLFRGHGLGCCVGDCSALFYESERESK